MSDEMVGQSEAFIKSYDIGKKDGYLQALEDIHKKINSVPALWPSISITLLKEWIAELKSIKVTI